MTLEVTQNAVDALEAYFDDKDIEPIRVFVGQGCGGPQLGLGLDNPTESDETHEVGKFTFVVDKELAEQASPIKVDVTPMGFTIDSPLDLGPAGGAGGGCGGCTGCG
jgi:Fe-S cluster assembly iron-binding protein IscA